MNTWNALRHSGLALTLFCALGTAASAQVSYQFTNFDGFGDHANGTTIDGLNNNGAEVGFSTDAAGNFTNFIRNPDGTFTSLTPPLGPTEQANGINTANQIVGLTDPAAPNAFLLQGGVHSILPNANANTTSEIAFGINDTGVIVGQYTDGVLGTTPGFVDKGGVFTTLNPVVNAAVTNAQGINNHGLVTGFYSLDGVHQHGFLYDTNTAMFTLLPDPSTARITSMGLTLTQFLGINDMGEAAGYYQTNDGSQFGFLFDTHTDMYTFLDDPFAAPVGGVQITQITGINDMGDLSGFYIDANGVQHGFFAAAVPEPGSLALLIVAGLGGIGLLRRRRGTA